MSNCKIFGKTFYDVINTHEGFDIDLTWLKGLIPRYSDSISGIWYPIRITNKNDRIGFDAFGSILTNPQNINDGSSSPCNCDSNSVRRNVSYSWDDTSDEAEDGQFCNYCEALNANHHMQCVATVEHRPKSGGAKTTFGWPLSTPISDPPTGQSTVYDVSCCEGGCDTRMKTDDITPKIPYLYNNYVINFQDFKYHLQFPAIENPPLGYERFAVYNQASGYRGLEPSGATLCVDWTLKARLGEIAPQGSETYHQNPYAHRKSYARYSLNNKTCGNFILYNVNESTPIAAWQKSKMSLISGLPITKPISENLPLTGVIPSPDNFTIPYGITDDTHHNIFLRSSKTKHGSFWKWNYSTGILGWFRYYEPKRINDIRPISGVDLYISDGDVLFASNDGPEPNAISGTVSANCLPKVCPSGLKFTKYQITDTSSTVTVLPSGSEFIYISTNIYPLAYDYTKLLIDLYKGPLNDTTVKYKDLLIIAAQLATSPTYAGITISTLKGPLTYSQAARQEFVNLIRTITKKNITLEQVNNWLDNYSWPSESIKLEKQLTDKKMVSYNDINMISSKKSLIDTLVHKYGCYFWIPPKSSGSITIDKNVPQHATIDVDFEPVIKYSDTFCSTGPTPKLDCSSLLRGSTKIFSYDQQLSIGDSNIKTKVLDENIVYSAYCVGNASESVKTDVSATMSIYFRDKPIFSQAYGNFNTSFETIYSRFPSVSSTLDDTFTDLDTVEDINEDTNVFFLNPDRQLSFKRYYKAVGSNPSVDLVGFHIQGGCYYDSTLLNKNPNGSGTVVFLKDWKPPKAKAKPSVSFKTYDVGIKLYSIHSELLRDPKNLDCKTLPLNQTCNCWGLSRVENYPYKCAATSPVVYETPGLYTPYLSTESIPLTSYGGYNSAKVDQLLGDFLIPNHPEPESLLPEITKPLDPVNPHGCAETYTITLPNYVASNWKLQIPDMDSNGASIWISYTDSFGFGPAAPRTQNRLVVNGKEIFPNEQTVLEASTNSLDIKIYNQLLTSVFEPNIDQYLYHPNMFTCSNERVAGYDQIPNAFAKVSTVTIKIGRLPNKNILAFNIPGIQSWGKLNKTFFEPNSGLVNSDQNGSALSLDRFNGLFNFDYDYKLFNNKQTYDVSISPGHKTVSGVTDFYNITQLNKFLNTLDNSKKIRVYFRVSGEWYEYNDHRTFGYYNTQEQQQYHSWPTVFSVHHETTEPIIGPFVPAIPKTPLEHTYMFNTQTWQNACKTGNAKYPFFGHLCRRDETDHKKIYIDGARAYFMFPNVKDDNNYNDKLFINQSNNQLINYFDEDKIPYPTKIYASGSGSIPESRVNLEPTSVYFTIVDYVNGFYFDKTKDTTYLDTNYIIRNTVVAKELLYNSNHYTSGSVNDLLVNKYNNVTTVLYMEQDVDYWFKSFSKGQGYVGFYYPDNPITNITLFSTTNIKNQPQDELIRLNKLSTNANIFSSKWGDLYYLNNTADILNNRIYYNSINSVYGPFTHDHMFMYDIVNNFSYSHLSTNIDGTCTPAATYNLYMKNGESGIRISLDNPIASFYIHQPFSIGEQKYSELLDRFNLYKNALSILDLNIYEKSTKDAEFLKIPRVDNLGLGVTGILCLSGINRPSYIHKHDSSQLSSASKYKFFVNLDDRFTLKPTPMSKATGDIYSQSFVMSETYNVFDGLVLTSKYDESTDTSICSNIVAPNITVPPNSSKSPFSWNIFNRVPFIGEVYQSYPIYCNIDDPYECTGLVPSYQCSMNSVGSLSVQSKFNTYTYREIPISSISDEVEYALNIDAGLYCPLSPTGKIPYIVRAEFTSYSPMFPTYSLNGDSSCVNGQSYPKLERGLSVWDALYQSEIKENIVNLLPHDTWANEMLFRSIHGAKQKINLNDIAKQNVNNSNDSFGKILENLLNRPDNNVSFIYDSIPYDYDQEATSKNLQVDGSIRIIGPVVVGSTIKIIYNNSTYNITVEENEEHIYLNCPEFNVKGLIATKIDRTNSIYLRQKGSNATSIINQYITEEVIGLCKSPMSFSASTICATSFPEETPSTCSLKPVAGPFKHTDTLCSPVGSQCPVGLVNPVLSIEDTATGNGISAYDPTTCSAFSIDQARPDAEGNLDSFLSKWAAATISGHGGGGSKAPKECGNFIIYPCSAKKGCCDNQTSLVQRLSYRVKSCHYSFTMKGLVTNSLTKNGSVKVDIPDVECQDVDTSGKDKLEEFKKLCCDCSNVNGSPPYVPLNPSTCPSGTVSSAICCVEYCKGALPGGQCIHAKLGCGSFTCEESMWVLSCNSPGTEYEVVRSTTSNPVINQNLGCNRFLALFSFNRNQIKLDLGTPLTVDNTVIFNGSNCIDRSTISCPSIRVEVPDDRYGVQDTMTSTCNNCDRQTKSIKIVDNPKWQFQIDDNICILGAIITGGSLNKLHTFGIDCDVSEEEADFYDAVAGLYQGRQCGKSIQNIGVCAAETSWHHFIGDPLLGNQNKGGTNECEQSITVKGGWLVNFPSYIYGGTDDYVKLWKIAMEEKFNSKHYCTNKYQYKESELIEGVIPGSCSLEFSSVSWPLSAFKLKVTCTEDKCGKQYEKISADASLNIAIAYIRYKYKYPLDLSDKLIDKFGGETISSSKCRTYYSMGGPKNNCRNGMFENGGTHFTNVVEMLKSTTSRDNNCIGPPQCYDKIRECDPTNYCCQMDPYGATYLNGQ